MSDKFTKSLILRSSTFSPDLLKFFLLYLVFRWRTKLLPDKAVSVVDSEVHQVVLAAIVVEDAAEVVDVVSGVDAKTALDSSLDAL